MNTYADSKSQLVNYVETLRNHTTKPSIIKAIDNLLVAINADDKKEEKMKSQKTKNFECTHPKKIAKGMCFSCYNKRGKPKKAFKCEHTDSPLYCQGLCQTCYLHQYYMGKRKNK